MCGIVGVGNFTARGAYSTDVEAFQDMLIADSVRGTDGTGILIVSTKGKYTWRKQVGNPFQLIHDKAVRDWMAEHYQKDIRFLVGHNRYGTTGKISTKSTHPFSVGKITLVHNGTAEKWSELAELKGTNYQTDSEGICAALDRLSLKGVVDKIYGPMALVWWNDEDKTLNLYRNAGRPLWFGIDKTKERIVFGSEPKLLHWATSRRAMPESIKYRQLSRYEYMTISLEKPEFKSVLVEPKRLYSGSSSMYGGYKGTTWEWDPATRSMVEKNSQHDLPFRHDPTKNKKHQQQQQEHKKSERQFGILNEYSGYAQGSQITFDAYNCEDNSTKHADEVYTLIGGVEDLPYVEMRMYVRGGKNRDALMEAPKVRGTIRSIVRNPKESKKLSKEIGAEVDVIVMYLSHPEPIYNPPACFKDVEDPFATIEIPMEQLPDGIDDDESSLANVHLGGGTAVH